MNPSQKVAALVESKADLSKLLPAGSYLNLNEKLCLDLAREYQSLENPDYSCISWKNQVKAEAYFNEHGFLETLNHLADLLGGEL